MPKRVYMEMTYKEIEALDRDKTVLLSAISPVEVHGPHLPMGSDIFIAENLRDRVRDRILERRPEFEAVTLPTLPLGADAIPMPGSLQLNAGAVERAVGDWSNSLAGLGFKYWMLFDNHGGPHHQMAIQTVAERMRGRGFHLIAPFALVFRRMVGLDDDLKSKTGLDKGSAGDVSDSHAGTNETSLMLAAAPGLVRDSYKELGPAPESPIKGLPAAVGKFGDWLGARGAADAGLDMFFISHALAWVKDPNMASYQGTPKLASREAGDKMLDYRAAVAAELLERAVAGEPYSIKPLGWSIRAIRKLI